MIFPAATLCALLLGSRPASAGAGADGASFLDIPVGARPAAMAGAYSALAEDAYAPVWNPAGLGLLPASQFSGMHLGQTGDGAYEFASLVHPFGDANGVGASAQYFHVDSNGRDAAGLDTGSFSSHYGAYSFALGRSCGHALSIGASAKLLEARLSDASARAAAADVGLLLTPREGLRLAFVAANLGSSLRFLEQADALPRQYRIGAALLPAETLIFSSEGVYESSSWAGRFGAEWSPVRAVAIRAGYRTDSTRQLPGVSGVTTGIGLKLWGQSFDYAWIPMGSLGPTQYFSITLTFGRRRA